MRKRRRKIREGMTQSQRAVLTAIWIIERIAGTVSPVCVDRIRQERILDLFPKTV